MKKAFAFSSLLLFFVYVSAQPTWERIETKITEPLHDIEFLNDCIGFIYSYGTGNIYQTRDAGLHWNKIKQTDSIYFEQIQFIDQDHGWICGEKGTVLKTTNAGKSWQNVSIERKDNSLLLYGMCFLNNTLGYVSGAEIRNKKLIPKAYTTTNGGVSWTDCYEDIPHMVLNLTKHGNYLFATGTGFIIKISLQKNTWTYAFLDTLRTVGQIRDLKFADDNFGMACSFNGIILVTKDSGESFTYRDITSNRLRGIAYLGRQEWMLVGDDNKNDDAVLHSSNDNGKSWQKNNDFPDIHRIYTTNNTIWIVGKEGLIAKRKIRLGAF